ncbi:hypothetical protein PUN28_005605 [Cardiocondyla obscurior]|uniref:Uncharacterized protein n=1 Tax=Cardiocondyla obscurior TaxID=286306 RepID=A0AAW2GIR4_9HYME
MLLQTFFATFSFAFLYNRQRYPPIILSLSPLNICIRRVRVIYGKARCKASKNKTSHYLHPNNSILTNTWAKQTRTSSENLSFKFQPTNHWLSRYKYVVVSGLVSPVVTVAKLGGIKIEKLNL